MPLTPISNVTVNMPQEVTCLLIDSHAVLALTDWMILWADDISTRNWSVSELAMFW